MTAAERIKEQEEIEAEQPANDLVYTIDDLVSVRSLSDKELAQKYRWARASRQITYEVRHDVVTTAYYAKERGGNTPEYFKGKMKIARDNYRAARKEYRTVRREMKRRNLIVKKAS